jgi:hypothetical protein
MKGGEQSAPNVRGKNFSSSLAPSRQRPQERAKPTSSRKKQRLCLCFSIPHFDLVTKMLKGPLNQQPPEAVVV